MTTPDQDANSEAPQSLGNCLYPTRLTHFESQLSISHMGNFHRVLITIHVADVSAKEFLLAVTLKITQKTILGYRSPAGQDTAASKTCVASNMSTSGLRTDQRTIIVTNPTNPSDDLLQMQQPCSFSPGYRGIYETDDGILGFVATVTGLMLFGMISHKRSGRIFGSLKLNTAPWDLLQIAEQANTSWSKDSGFAHGPWFVGLSRRGESVFKA
ncbi:hypothetical protein BO71DRAFT_487305 [Aspergillus ellipticus CBS 707.79]|uniref:Uncharacterized protein n=1 Tax=Aspergillus ellipticus CBS 707.79 TaxID=1448320 RepID=A0A319DQ40_9EURO|nr:hypothetical protein BO71DRAFT_487305 [Aspergillus ellipticus CBS 707.79]